MKALFLAPVLLLAACASVPEERIRIVETKVPVPRACVPLSLEAKPAAYADADLSNGTPPDERYRLTAQANQERKSRLAKIEPVIAGCR